MNETLQTFICAIGLISVLAFFAYASIQGMDKSDVNEQNI